MSTTTPSITLPSLFPREAVIDGIHRAVEGIDTQNEALWSSAILVSPDTSFSVNGDVVCTGSDALNGYILSNIFPLATTHHVSNIRVDLKDGADTAIVSARVVAYHYTPESAFEAEKQTGGKFVAGGCYTVEMVRDRDELWKLRTWDLTIKWSEGDRSVLESQAKARALTREA